MSVSEAAFNLLASLVKQRSGIILSRDKAYLIDSRLAPVARRHELAGVDALAATLARAPSEALATEVVEAMINNETLFFRDRIPFDLLSNVALPALRRSRAPTRTIRIWCAAASTGQEPYSIAMMLAEQKAMWANWTIEIIGTDLSRRALSYAENGLYSQFEVQRGLPIQMLLRDFDQDGDNWQLREPIRRMVRFRQINLCQPFAHLGLFDIILCRNVLMYLDKAARIDILSRMRQQMPVDGTLVLGAAETVLGLSDEFTPHWSHRGLYVPVNPPDACHVVSA